MAFPVLALVATFAALLDLLINRVVLRTLSEIAHPRVLFALGPWGSLARNLSAIAGLVAIASALLSVLQSSRYASLRRRLFIAGGAGILLPTGLLATFGPSQLTSPQIVLLGTGAGNMLAVLLGLTGIRKTTPRPIRLALSLGTAAALFGFGALLLAISNSLFHLTLTESLSQVVRRAGELAYLVFPVLLAVTLLTGGIRDTWRRWLGMALVSTLVILLFFVTLRIVREQFPDVLYGAQHLEWLLESAPLVYALPLAIGFSVGTVALCSSTPGMRLIGAGLLLTYAAGYAPRATAEVLMMTLGMILLARGAIALSDETSEPVEQTEPAAAPVGDDANAA